jgi:predicted HTH transcriptional regulator
MTDTEDNITVPPDHHEIFYRLPIFVRIAVYDNFTSIPRIIDLKHDSVNDFIDITTEKIYQISHGQGGKIPYTIIKEIVENLIHAEFSEVIITIINNGNQIMITDQGPGISDIDKAMMPGFTSATKEMKKFIRGVGSGLPIVKETIRFSGGTIDIKNNINRGTVVVLKINSSESSIGDFNPSPAAAAGTVNDAAGKEPLINPEKIISHMENPVPDTALRVPFPKQDKADGFSGNPIPEDYNSLKLTLRQIKILYLTLELEEAGPSVISKELGFSLSTSFRELSYLEREGLLKTFSSGKKKLSKKGFKYLEYYSNTF